MLDEGHRNATLIDFGLAAFCHPNKKLVRACGSPSYAAPEVLAQMWVELSKGQE